MYLTFSSQTTEECLFQSSRAQQPLNFREPWSFQIPAIPCLCSEFFRGRSLSSSTWGDVAQACPPPRPPPKASIPRLPPPPPQSAHPLLELRYRHRLSGRRQGLSPLLAHMLVSLKGTQLSCGKFIFIPQGWSEPLLPSMWPSPPVSGSPRIPLVLLTEVSRGGQEAPSQKTRLDPGFSALLLRPWSSNLTSVPVPPLVTQGRKGTTGRLSVWFKWVRQKALTTGTVTGHISKR